jgi:mxaJ protein
MNVSRAPRLAAACIFACVACAKADAKTAGAEFRVCADPNNLPFSNSAQQGFENKLANLIASDLHAQVRYTWFAQRRGFIRNTLNTHQCDVVMGVPSSFGLAFTTRPYYRSTYVFITRRNSGIKVRSFDDPVLRKVRIGVQLIGDDYANTPPAHALSARGIISNVRGYLVYGDYSTPHPPSAIVDAVRKGDVDVAIAWGPMAGFFARNSDPPLDIVPVSPQVDLPFLPHVFDISMAVRRDDKPLKYKLDSLLEREQPRINSILAEYGVPRVDVTVPRDAATEEK